MRYGLIGAKLSHTYSPAIHAFFGNNDYGDKEIKEEELENFLLNEPWEAINITIPYKQAVMPYCILSEEAKRIGAVNTIIKKDGKLYGYNTDYMGFKLCADRANISFDGAKVLILGSGGTSKTVRAVAYDNNAREVVRISRGGKDNYDTISNHYDADIIVNTTPVGMYPNVDGCSLDTKPFKNLKGVMDAIYNPLRTKLLLQREDVAYTGGLPMLVGQALYAHNIFFEKDDISIFEEALKKAEALFRNVAIIGMPGSGKTCLGKMLSEKLNAKLVDVDDEVLKRTGSRAKDIILNQGEEAFRDIEASIIKEYAFKTGYVIATGGGSILREDNREALRSNATIIYLERDLDKLVTCDRPLSCDLEKLFEKRAPIYSSLADFNVKNEGDLQSVVEKVMENLA